MNESPERVDVVVVGSGLAGMCAAAAAVEQGASVVVLEKAPMHERGGNGRFTIHFSFVFDSPSKDLYELCPELKSISGDRRLTLKPQTTDQFVDGVMSASRGSVEREWATLLADLSLPTMKWLTSLGVDWELNLAEAQETDGRLCWDNPALTLRPVGEGLGVLETLYAFVERSDRTALRYETPVVELSQTTNGAVNGVFIQASEKRQMLRSRCVILASGGFEANPQMRAQYLGKDWDLAKVRGTRHNTGEGLMEALRLGAQPSGHWSAAHATIVRANASEYEIDRASFPFAFPYSILVASTGERFVDEGADRLHRTYGLIGALVVSNPGSRAFELFDARTRSIRERSRPSPYDEPLAVGRTIEQVATKSGMVNPQGLSSTVAAFNEAALGDVEFDPVRPDGLRTAGLAINKSNWALPLQEPPFELFAVVPGITFTYGGIRTDSSGRVIHRSGETIPGLYAVGEIAGTFFVNYPVGVALTKNAVFGRLTGEHAARFAS